MTVTYDFGAGGFAVEFDCPALSSGQYIQVKSDSAVTVEDKDLSSPYSRFRIHSYGGGSYNCNIRNNANEVIERFAWETGAGDLHISWTVFSKYITLYVNGVWIKTFCLEDVHHNEEPQVWLEGTAGLVITNIVFPELNDWRDAIYIDLEQTGINAVQSVIQSKPVEIWSIYSGEICFAYDPPHEEIPIKYIRKYIPQISMDSMACSDGIVYFTDVAVVVDEDYLGDYGFVTKLIRLPDLDYGTRAGKRMQSRARERITRREAITRFNPQIEYQDALCVDCYMTSSGSYFDEKFIVERISLQLDDMTNNMTVAGRLVP